MLFLQGVGLLIVLNRVYDNFTHCKNIILYALVHEDSKRSAIPMFRKEDGNWESVKMMFLNVF